MSKEQNDALFERAKNRILDNIPVGADQPFVLRSVLDLMRFDSEKDKDALRKRCIRFLNKLYRQTEDEFVITSSGQANAYYWRSELKREFFIRKLFPSYFNKNQAIAFYLVDTYFGDMLPPKIRQQLQASFDLALTSIADDQEWLNPLDAAKGKIAFKPSGFDVSAREGDPQLYAKVFDALENEYILQAEYPSIHTAQNLSADEAAYTIEIFSPQQIILQNLQHYVLAYRHNVDQSPFKMLTIARLRNIQKYQGKDYRYIREQRKTFPYTLKMHASLGIKNYFDQVRLGDNYKFSPNGDGTWLLEADINLPQRFDRDKPDTFYVCNMLSAYGGEVEVIEPDIVRNEMKERALKMASIYGDD